MNERDRKKIDNLCNSLTEDMIDMCKLWPKLLLNRVFNEDDVNVSNWMKNLNDIRTVLNICQTIKTRGPHAFENFIKSLNESGHHVLVDILRNQNSNIPRITPPNYVLCNSSAESEVESEDEDDCSTADNYHTKVSLIDGPLEIKVKQATKFRDIPDFKNIEMYPMRSKPRGIVLIITNIHYVDETVPNRPSGARDEVSLNELFTQMGFEVKSYFNLTKEEIKKTVEKFSKLKELRIVDSAFVIFSCHGTGELGNQNTKVQGVDFKYEVEAGVYCMDILEYFTSSKCVYLRGKPKVFIFQTCRGNKYQPSMGRTQVDMAPYDTTKKEYEPIKEEPTSRNFEDMIIAYANVSGHFSFRDSINGSWFIQILCEVFMNYAHKKHLSDLFTMTDSRMKHLRTGDRHCQTMVTISKGFSKHCYLNPGLFQT